MEGSDWQTDYHPYGYEEGIPIGLGMSNDNQPYQLTINPDQNMQQQLILILHAFVCQEQDRHHQFNGTSWFCSDPLCQAMKFLLSHIPICQAETVCTIPYCSSSKSVIAHWKQCLQMDCPVCAPVRASDLGHCVMMTRASNWQQNHHPDQYQNEALHYPGQYPNMAVDYSGQYQNEVNYSGQYQNVPVPYFDQYQTESIYHFGQYQNVVKPAFKLSDIGKDYEPYKWSPIPGNWRIQYHIILIVHACLCEDLEYPFKGLKCTLPYCKSMKNLMDHVRECQEKENCTVSYCYFTKGIVGHWRKCININCDVCIPLKKALKHRTMLFGVATTSNKTTSVKGHEHQSPTRITPVQQTEDMVEDVRNTEVQINETNIPRQVENMEKSLCQQNSLSPNNNSTAVKAHEHQSPDTSDQQTKDVVEHSSKRTKVKIIKKSILSQEEIKENYREILEQDLSNYISREKVLRWLRSH